MSERTPGQVHVYLPAEIEAVLSRHMKARELSRAQAVRNALLVWGWLEDQRAEGRQVISRGTDGERELAWP